MFAISAHCTKTYVLDSLVYFLFASPKTPSPRLVLATFSLAQHSSFPTFLFGRTEEVVTAPPPLATYAESLNRLLIGLFSRKGQTETRFSNHLESLFSHTNVR